MEFEFTPYQEIEWSGRYCRPYGKQGNYHVNHKGGIFIRNYQYYGLYLDYKDYHAVMSKTSIKLAKAISECKNRHGNNWDGIGGSFSINEYGIVIVPVVIQNMPMETRIKYYAIGKCSGGLNFIDKETGKLFNLNPDLRPGSKWEWPYLGMKFYLSSKDEFFFQWDDETGRSKQPLGMDNIPLRMAIRNIRRYGLVSFVVNNHGVVLVKKQDDRKEDYWQPYYVGHLDYSKWFADEFKEIMNRKKTEVNLMAELSKLRRYLWSEEDQELFAKQMHVYIHNGHQIDSEMEIVLQKLLNKYSK